MRKAIRKIHSAAERLIPAASRLTDDQLAIFLFHGVVEEPSCEVRNYTGKHVLVDEFVTILRSLQSAGTSLSMDDVIECSVADEPFPPRAFAITFDDGFANNYDVAVPILSEFGVPATFYVTSGFIDNNWMSWIDRIEYCLEIATAGKLQLPWNDSVTTFGSAHRKIAILKEIRREVKLDPELDIERLVLNVFWQCGVAAISSNDHVLDQKMNWQQVARIHSDPLFTVGGHTHTHRIMSFLSKDELRQEVACSLQLLRERASIDGRHYSYPEGLAHCYNDEVIERLKAEGVICCPTAEDGVNRMGESLFHLKRIMIG